MGIWLPGGVPAGPGVEKAAAKAAANAIELSHGAAGLSGNGEAYGNLADVGAVSWTLVEKPPLLMCEGGGGRGSDDAKDDAE